MPRHNRPIKHEPFQFVSRCQNKRRFPDERQAKEAAEHQMLIKPSLTLSTYKCESCGGWHLTRQTKSS